MATKLGTTDVSFRLGAATPKKVAIGAAEVWTDFVPTAPGLPTGLTVATDEDAQSSVDANWTAPASDGGLPITAYKVYTSFDAETYSLHATTAGTSFSVAAGGYGGQTIYIKVSAVNAAGEGSQSEAASGTMSDSVPSAPGTPTLGVTGPGELTLSWQAPDSDGGDAITGYLITYTKPPSATEYTDAVGASTLAYIFTDSAGVQYSAVVAATNMIGTGAATAAQSATTADVPGSPSWMSAAASAYTAGAIDINFLAPGGNGGSAITGYELEYDTSDVFSTPVSVQFSDSPYTLEGLEGGLGYHLRLRALNAAGESEWATWGSNPVPASATLPGIPTSLSVTPDYANAEWDATWSAPSDGGSSITGYDIQESDQDFVSPTTINSSGTSTSYSFSVTAGDQVRTFRIRAVNAVGNGEWSEWISVTHDTPTVPGAPTITSAVWNGSQTVVDWLYPADDGNSGITSLTVYFDGVAATPVTVLSGTHYFDTDYTGQDATMTATNAVGEGAASSAVEVTTS